MGQADEALGADKRGGILALVDDFIFQILSIRKIVLIIFASSIILGPPCIVLSAYLLTHPTFERTLDAEDNFGEILLLLLGSTISISSIIVLFGVRQYRSIGSWDRRFKEYLRAQKDLESKIMAGHYMNENEE